MLSPQNGCLWGEWNHTGKYSLTEWESRLGRKLTVNHHFLQFTSTYNSSTILADYHAGRIPLINWANIRDIAGIANGKYDSTINRVVQQLHSLPGPVMLTFWAEMDRDGFPFDISKAAQRRVYQHIGSGTNVTRIWCPTGAGFKGRSPRAPLYYPGDDVVDHIGADGYCWPFRSGKPSMKDIFTPAVDFAKAHHKRLSVPEFGCRIDLGDGFRKVWLTAAHAYVKSEPTFAMVNYFNSDPHDSTGIDWRLLSSGSFDAWKAWGADPYFKPSI